MSESEKLNYYEILGIKPTARLIDIKKAFRKKTMQYHPDRQSTKSDIEKARDISSKLNKAYEILSNKQTRLEYDIENGYQENDTSNIQKLNEYKSQEIKTTKDNLINIAKKSREIESKVKIKTIDNQIYENAGLLIIKAKYGYLNLKKSEIKSGTFFFTLKI